MITKSKKTIFISFYFETWSYMQLQVIIWVYSCISSRHLVLHMFLFSCVFQIPQPIENPWSAGTHINGWRSRNLTYAIASWIKNLSCSTSLNTIAHCSTQCTYLNPLWIHWTIISKYLCTVFKTQTCSKVFSFYTLPESFLINQKEFFTIIKNNTILLTLSPLTALFLYIGSRSMCLLSAEIQDSMTPRVHWFSHN